MKNAKYLKFKFFLSFLFLGFRLFSQNETNNWYFGLQAGLNFSTSPPSVLINSAMNSVEGTATISDSNGNLLFYCNGENVWNKTHNLMANGTGLLGHNSTTQSALIVKQPNSNSIYYLFTLDQVGNANGLRYSIVDISLAAGLGSVTIKNSLLYSPSCEKLTGTLHCNGNDVWVLSHDFNSNSFRAYLITNSGISSSPVITNIGNNITNTYNTVGYLKVSPNGKKIVAAYGGAITIGYYEIYDFDNSTGIVSNLLNLGSFYAPYSCEFSPDGTKLFASDTNTPTLMEWDLCVPIYTNVPTSLYSVSTGSAFPNNSIFAMQLAKDGKIYFVHGGTNYLLGSINNPNNFGASINMTFSVLNVSPKNTVKGLPNFIATGFKTQPPPYTYTATCQTASFTGIASSASIINNCAAASYSLIGNSWDFGDVASGAISNLSNLINPTHVYTAPGTYTAMLVLNYQCSSDTLRQIINITSPSPTFAVIGPTAICKGEKAIFTTSPNYSFSWSNGATSNTIAVTPTANINYVATATASNGCKWNVTVPLIVNKCLSFGELLGNNEEVLVYPNPASEMLNVECKMLNETRVKISNILGEIVFDKILNANKEEINISNWAKGIYLMQINSREKVVVKKLIVE